MSRIKVTEKLFKDAKKDYEYRLSLHERNKEIDWVLDLYSSTAGTKFSVNEGFKETPYGISVRTYCQKVFAGGYKTFLYELCNESLGFSCEVQGELVFHLKEK